MFLPEFLSRQHHGVVPALNVLSLSVSSWMSGLMKREHEKFDKDGCEQMKRWEARSAAVSEAVNQSRALNHWTDAQRWGGKHAARALTRGRLYPSAR